ncbi:MAG: phage tail tape measure protein [Acinetobacter sp.]
MSNTTVRVTLQLQGRQAQSVLNQLNQSQKSSANELLRTNRMIEGVLRQQVQQTRIQSQQLQQLTRLNQQNTQNVTRQNQQTQATLRTNQLLERILQQQTRQTTIQTQQARNQSREYQLQLNMLRQQVAAAERLRQQLEQAGRAGRGLGGGIGGGRISGGLQNTAAVAGGAYAAGSIVTNYLDDPRQYMKQVSLATDTVLAGQKLPIQEFNRKVTEMEGFVRKAAVSGGSRPQDLVQGLNTLVASNVYEFDQLKDVMTQVSRTAFSAGAEPNDIAAMAVAQKNFGLTDLSRANDQAMKAGQLGSFELRDMARYMPDLLTQGKGAGYIGDKGYQDLLVMMQLSKKTAGTSEGAAVNLSDLLGSFSQYHLGLSFAKHVRVQDGDPVAAYGVSKKRSGFDWTTYAANMREKGVGEVEAAALIMNRQMETSPLYRKYRDKSQEALKSGNNAEYLQNLQAATQIAAQSEVGKIFHNKQALMSFMGITMNMGAGGFKENLERGISDSAGTIDESHKRQAAQEYGKDGSFDTARFNAKVDVYNGNADWLGNLKQKLADFASSNEGVAAAASAAVVGLTAVAAAGGVAAIAMRRGGGIGAGLGGGAAAGGAMGAARSAGAIAGVGLLSYGLTTMALNTETGQKFQNNLSEKTSLGSDIAEVLAFFGNDEAQASIDAQAKYDEMIAQQEQSNKISQDMATKLSALINVTSQNKPLPFNFPSGGLLGDISRNAADEEKRHGAALLTYKPN